MAVSPIRDQHYRKVVEGLSGHADPIIFEAVVVRLLRPIFPGIAALPGGKDRGRDGLIPDGEAEPFPLIATTAEDVLGNLTSSLESYAVLPRHRDRAVLVTSRSLTPDRVTALFDRAHEKGFALIQVYQQQDVADWLYRDAKSCKELLGLSGAPAALSPVPASRRIDAAMPLIGREQDLEWLRATEGDRLLVGQPGSGKTALLRELVAEGRGLFLVTDDEARIADDLRDRYDGSGPSLVLVDDAHAHLERIDLLRRLRDEVESSFHVIATAWPSSRDMVREALGHAPAIRQLELLGRDKLVALYAAMRIAGPEDLVRELVDQASNKPGLAATLAFLWLRGERRDVLTGDALARHLRTTLQSHLGQDPTPLLASVALAGWRGVEPEVIAAF